MSAILTETDTVPWDVDPEHRWCHDLAMLRLEARRRSGAPVRPGDAVLLEAWRARLAADDLVVHYDRETEEGFWYVPRRPGVDLGLVREPDPAD